MEFAMARRSIDTLVISAAYYDRGELPEEQFTEIVTDRLPQIPYRNSVAIVVRLIGPPNQSTVVELYMALLRCWRAAHFLLTARYLYVS